MIWVCLYLTVGLIVATIALAYEYVNDTKDATVVPDIIDWMDVNYAEAMMWMIIIYPIFLVWLLWSGFFKLIVWLIEDKR